MTLENFDPIGQWRKHYDKKKKMLVDATANAPNGEEIKNVKSLKNFLMKRKETFARGLTAKLMSYAVGREMSYVESHEIDRIIEEIRKKDGFKDLLTYIVNSEIFLNK